MGPLLCDIIWRENMINHLYKNLSNSINNIFILQAKWYPQTTDMNFAHENFAQCKLYPQALCPQGNLLPTINQSINQSINQPTNQPTNQYSIQITTQDI